MVNAAAKWFLRQLIRVPAIRQYLQYQVGPPGLNKPMPPPGPFDTPIPDLEEIEKYVGKIYETSSIDDSVRLNLDEQRRLLVAFAEYYPQFDWGEHATPRGRFYLKNGFFEHGDAVALYSMIRHFRPRRIIEVGSGFSSALMLDTNDRDCDPKMELIFIEPYPERLESLLKEEDKTSMRLIVAPVQDVPLETFDVLGANDILFIDSSHVAKFGSDVNYLIFSVLPRLQSGVLVHFHDIFYPFEYPLAWLREGRAWNEVYLLRAFLQFNSAFEVLLFNSYLWHQSVPLIKQHLPAMAVNPGGSIWLRKTSHTAEWQAAAAPAVRPQAVA
jgi:hypothetical protein